MIDLASLTDRLDRALEHLETLDRDVRKFLDTEPYTVLPEHNPDTGGYVWRAKVQREPPRPLSFVVGDCVHNIRSPLDNLVWMLSEGAPDNARKNVAFVIAADEADFGRQRWKLNALPDSAQSLIANVQPFATGELPDTGHVQMRTAGVADTPIVFDLVDPYARTDERGRAEKHPLWVLERLWNDDKHRSPALIGATSRAYQLIHSGFTLPPFSAIEIEMSIRVVHDGDIIASFLPPPGFISKGEIKLKPVFEIALDKQGEGFDGSVLDLLRKLHDHVRYTLLPQFAKL